jgi:hypothetical protein
MSLTGSVDAARNPERLVSLDHEAVLELARASAGTGYGHLLWRCRAFI